MRRTTAAIFAVLFIMLGVGAPGVGAYSNGQLPEAALSPAATGVKCDKPLGQFANEAAAAYNSMALAAGKRLPTNGCDSAYRPYQRQLYYWNLYITGRGNLAAYPGSSNHGWGTAGDESTWVQGYMRLHGDRFCWRKTEAFSEPWHWNYTGCFRRPNPGTNLHSPILRRHSGGPGQNVYVRKVQKLLRGHGDKTVVVNGSFEWKTARAVRRFQKAQRLKVNGVVSPRVWKRLRRPISKPVKTTPKKVPAGGTAAPPATPHKHRRHHKKRHHRAPNRKAWGIDISSNNGCRATGHPNINFKKVRRDGATFAITKATQGVWYLNPCFGRAQVRAIGAAHLVPGVYHWIEPGGASGKAEAAYFANTIGHAGYGKGFLQPFVDVEEHSSISSAAYCRELGEFVHTLKRVLGEKPIIYSTPSFVADELGGARCGYLNHYRLWIAHLGVKRPDVPAPFARWALWQYTWTAHVAGVPGEVDVSKVYGGTRALAKLRVRDIPRRVRKAPRAKLELPLEAEPKAVLRQAAPDRRTKGGE
jgi:GH25 family lysozyme M1 (1,4-beta-N-acetylmuramidase)